MKENYTYRAVLDSSEEGFINIIFPDFDNSVTSVEAGENPIEAAQEWLALNIAACEEEGLPTPEESILPVDLDDNQSLVFINVWMPYHRAKEKIVYVKKTLTIPQYLDILGKENKLNFSEILTNGLKQALHLK